MSEEHLINIEELVSAIGCDNLIGTDFLSDEDSIVIDEIDHHAYNGRKDGNRNSWLELKKKCIDALQKSKDLGIALLLFESLSVLHDCQGVYEGLHFLYEFFKKYQDKMYPIDNESKRELFNEFLIKEDSYISRTIYMCKIEYTENAYSYTDYLNAKNLDEKNDKLDRINNKIINLPEKNSIKFYNNSIEYLNKSENLLLDLEKILYSINLLDQILDNNGFIIIKNNLLTLKSLFLQINPDRKYQEKTPVTTNGISKVNGKVLQDNSILIKNRSEAFQTIKKISDILLKNDPHSPAAYLLENIKEWENKTAIYIYNQLFNLIDNDGNIQEIKDKSDQTINSTLYDRNKTYAMLESVLNYFQYYEPQSPIRNIVYKIISWKDQKLTEEMLLQIKDDKKKTKILEFLNINNKTEGDKNE